jgi:CDP-4-dehydro-6-deoxyglucose reductase
VRLTDEEGHSGRYAIASCPCDGRNLEFLIPWREGDGFAQGVQDGRIKNQAVEVHGPFGDFVLREDSRRPGVFVAIGPGFGAVKSLLEHAIAGEATARLHLYRVDHPMPRGRLDNLCRSWEDSLDNFSCTLIAPDLPASVTLMRIREDLPELDDCDLYLAGPAAQVEALLEVAKSTGLPPERIRWTCLD